MGLGQNQISFSTFPKIQPQLPCFGRWKKSKYGNAWWREVKQVLSSWHCHGGCEGLSRTLKGWLTGAMVKLCQAQQAKVDKCTAIKKIQRKPAEGSGRIETAGDFSVIVDPYLWKLLKNEVMMTFHLMLLLNKFQFQHLHFVRCPNIEVLAHTIIIPWCGIPLRTRRCWPNVSLIPILLCQKGIPPFFLQKPGGFQSSMLA